MDNKEILKSELREIIHDVYGSDLNGIYYFAKDIFEVVNDLIKEFE